MTDKQRKFCDEYLIDCNATQAAIRAGYSKKTARSIGEENLTKLDIKAYIAEKMEQVSSEKIATAEEVMQFLTSVLRGDFEEETLAFVGEGVQSVTTLAIASKDRIKAAELLGKRYGMFKDNIDLGGSIPIFIGSEKFNDEE